MPYYEYHCPSNGRTLEVRHGMNERLESWGEVADRAGADPGDTPAETPVERLLSAPVPITGTDGDTGFQGCGDSCACAGQA